MHLIQRSAAAIAVAATVATPAAHAANNAPPADFIQLLQRISGQYAIMVTRSLVDLTYDAIQVEPKTNNLIVSGLRLYPEFEWDQNYDCVIDIDRALFGGVQGFDLLQSVIEFSGVTLDPACLPPDVGGMLAAFGYEKLTATTMVVDIAYDLPTAGADVTVQAAIQEAGDLTLSASFDYLWFRFPLDGSDEPIPVAILDTAELAFENAGVWERVEPMVIGQIGDPAAVPPMIQAMLGQMLSEGGTRTPSEAETAFIANLASEAERFLAEKNRIVIAAAPESGLFLEPEAFASPAEAIASLQPRVSGTPLAFETMIDAGALTSALNGNVDEAERLRVGRALVTGFGAPLAPREGQALLMPLADGWNGEAASALASSLEETEPAQAYEMVLRALAAGERGVAGLADRIEARMSLSDVLSAQDKALETWPGAEAYNDPATNARETGDVSAMRRLATNALVGQQMPRNYRAAYLWASLAAAAGDRGGAGLRNRMDARFAGDPAWQAASAKVATEALQAWTSGGIAAAVAARMR
ncbi:MAG: hypothetical protein AAF479_00635 [Pseudomonadota bacterium]